MCFQWFEEKFPIVKGCFSCMAPICLLEWIGLQVKPPHAHPSIDRSRSRFHLHLLYSQILTRTKLTPNCLYEETLVLKYFSQVKPESMEYKLNYSKNQIFYLGNSQWFHTFTVSLGGLLDLLSDGFSTLLNSPIMNKGDAILQELLW